MEALTRIELITDTEIAESERVLGYNCKVFKKRQRKGLSKRIVCASIAQIFGFSLDKNTCMYGCQMYLVMCVLSTGSVHMNTSCSLFFFTNSDR